MKKERVFALIALAFVLALAAFFMVVRLVRAFNGPPSGCTPPNCQGAVGVNSSNNLSVGTTTPLANTKFLIVASDTSASNYSLEILQPATTPILVVENGGLIGIATGSPAYQLDVVGTVRATTLIGNWSGTLTSNNVTNGVFGSCGTCGGGIYSFPSSLGVATSTNGTLPATLSVYGTAQFTQTSTFLANVSSSALCLGGACKSAWPSGGSVSTSSPITAGYFPYWANTTGGLMGTSTIFFSGGNVGIGTANPANTLDVAGTYNDFQKFLSVGTTTGAGPGCYGSGCLTIVPYPYSGATALSIQDTTSTNTAITLRGAGGGDDFKLFDSGAVVIGGYQQQGSNALTVNGGGYFTGNVSTSALCLGGTCNSTWPSGGGLSGGQANYIPLWTSATAQGTSTIYQSGSNVGIGMTGPVSKLDVSGGDLQVETGEGRFKGWYNAGSGLATEIGISGGQGYIVTYDRTASTYSTTNIESQLTNLVVATSSFSFTGGNVGIGTTSTIDLLTVGNGAGTAGVGVNVGTGVNNGQFRFYRNGTYEGGLTMPNSSNDLWLISGGNAAVGVDVNNGGMSVGSYMGVNAAPSNGMIVSGNVGIGTTGPQAEFDLGGATGVKQLVYGGGGNSGYFAGLGTDLISGMNSIDLFMGYGTGSNTAFNVVYPTGTSTYPYGSTYKAALTVLNTGNVGIGTTAPGQKLEVVGNVSSSAVCLGGTCNSTWPSGGGTVGGSGTANTVPLWTAGTTLGNSILTQSGTTISVNGGSGKITVGTIDPVYTIGGQKYATYVPGMTGQKEETTGLVDLACAGGTCSSVIDFSKLDKGSNLWIFWQATDFGTKMENLVVSLTPAFDGRVWYEKDAVANTLTIFGSAAGEVSYRLTANRFDWQEWPNTSSDFVTGLTPPEK
jgi:hypothetical protein